MRVGLWFRRGSRWAQDVWRFALEHTRHSLGRRREFACLRAAGLVIFSWAFIAPILSGLNVVAAQAGAVGGSAEPASQSGESPSPQGVIRITVNLVQVDAIVTDSKGHQVTNLGPADFEILEDGRPQTITNFSYIFTAKPAGIEAHAATPPAAAGIPAVPPARLQPGEVRRSIVVLVDDFDIAFADMAYVRKALHKFIDDDVQPTDLVAILHTSGGLGVSQQFTNDKRVLHAVVDRLRYNVLYGWGWEPMGSGGRGHGEKNQLEGVRKDLEAAERGESDFRHQATASASLGALEYVVGGLRDLPGRKAVFLVSRGFPICMTPACTMEEKLREIADLANRCAVVIDAISAQGLSSLSLDASMSEEGLSTLSTDASMTVKPRADPRWYADSLYSMHSAYFYAQGSMADLAQWTEGLFVHDTNDLAGGMRDMMDDLSGYYLIGYKPPDDTFKEGKPGRYYHRIQVKVKVRGLHVRTRPGFFGVTDQESRPVYHTPEEQLKAAVISPFGTSGVGVQLAPQFLNEGGEDSVARLRLHIDARDLTFQDAPDGSKKATADLLALAYGDNGVVASEVEATLEGSLPPGKLEALRQRGVNYRLDLPIKEPGGYQVRVAVRDEPSQKVGSAGQFIEVPDLRSGRLALSGIVLNAKALGESGPAVRRLKAGDRVSYGLEIYNARRANAARIPNLEGTIQIFRDGRLVSAQNPGAISQDPSDSKRLVVSGELALAQDMAPGDYLLLVTLTDKLAPPRYAAARQWIDFEVVP